MRRSSYRFLPVAGGLEICAPWPLAILRPLTTLWGQHLMGGLCSRPAVRHETARIENKPNAAQFIQQYESQEMPARKPVTVAPAQPAATAAAGQQEAAAAAAGQQT